MPQQGRLAGSKKGRKRVLRQMKKLVGVVRAHARRHRELLDEHWERAQWNWRPSVVAKVMTSVGQPAGIHRSIRLPLLDTNGHGHPARVADAKDPMSRLRCRGGAQGSQHRPAPVIVQYLDFDGAEAGKFPAALKGRFLGAPKATE